MFYKSFVNQVLSFIVENKLTYRRHTREELEAINTKILEGTISKEDHFIAGNEPA